LEEYTLATKNNSYKIHLKPSKKPPQPLLIATTVHNHLKITRQAKFKVDDYVRISKYKHVFEKGYTPNWTTGIYNIN